MTTCTTYYRKSTVCKAINTPQTVNKPCLYRNSAFTIIAVNLTGTFAKTLCHSTNTSHIEYILQMLIPHYDLRFDPNLIVHTKKVYTRKQKNEQ